MATKIKIDQVKEKINMLSFNECVELFNELPKGNDMIDLVFDRMEQLDFDRFDKFLDS